MSTPQFFHDGLTIRGAILLVPMQAGHTLILKAYANPIDTTVNPISPNCGEELQNNAEVIREQLLGELSTPFRSSPPIQGSVLAKKTIF